MKQAAKPAFSRTDWRGTPFEVGCLVAYNLSGDVVLGEVVSLPPNGFSGSTKVRLLHPACGLRPDHISIIKRPKSMLVVATPERWRG